jgi:hypothetical protein
MGSRSTSICVDSSLIIRQRNSTKDSCAAIKMGSIAEALAVYRRLRQKLSVTLGIAPSPACQEMYPVLQCG